MNKTSSDDISFGEWIRQRRHILDLTQQELADQIGCARITLRRIEAGTLKPSKELAQILLEKLDAPLANDEAWLRFSRGLAEFPEASANHLVRKPLTNLPTSLTSFIGRDKEQGEIINLLQKKPLVTLAGAGGIGKTRLAIQVGQRLLNDYPNGVWFVPLDSLSDPALVPQTVASAFDIQEGSSEQPLLERLTYSLRQKTALLIFDNCEHLLDACAQLTKTLLTNCPNLKILATSREVLNLEGEATYYLPPLSTPDDNLALEKWAEYESIRLFTERASLTRSSFRLTKENDQIIADICRKVDGIPLAIELAAAYIDTLQAKEILKQLNESFSLLASDSRIVLPRHQTMEASLDWSWGLLTPSEQTFMRQLSIFAGGWTLEAAQAVCQGDALNLTRALVKKSLIVVDREPERERRYRFHEMVRHYAWEKLILAGDEENVRTRHLKYFLQFSAEAESELRGPTQAEWYARRNEERDNIRAALEWADQTNVEAGLYLSSRLHRPWEENDFQEGHYWLPKFLEKPESHAYPSVRAKALKAHVWILNQLEQFDRARSSAQECLELYRALEDRQGEVDALVSVSWQESNPAEKLALIQQALGLAQSLEYIRGQADALKVLGWLDQANDFAHWRQAIALTRQLGDWLGLANRLSTMGWFLILNGDIEAAQKCLDEASVLFQQLNRKSSGTELLGSYGQIALIQGNFEKARTYFQESATIGMEFGNRMAYLWDRVHLGYVALGAGNLHEARDILEETVRDFQKDGSLMGVVFTLEGMAGLFVAIQKPAIAARLIGWANATREKTGDPRPRLEQADVDQIIAVCPDKMGEVAFSDAYEEGQKMTLDEAVAYALNES